MHAWFQPLGRLLARLRTATALGKEVVFGRPQLVRHCDVVGRWSRVRIGKAIIDNRGRIEIGSRVRLTCGDGPIELRSGPDGLVTIGSRTGINFGTLIEASERVAIGDNVSIGPYVIISDTESGVDGPSGEARPITIGDDAWLASRVIVRPGAEIGSGAVISAGSIVDGVIPARVLAGGIPARVLRRLDDVGQDDAGVATAEETAPSPDREVVPTTIQEEQPPIGAGLLISDFTIDPLALALATSRPAIEAEIAPFGAVMATLLDPPDGPRDLAVVWTRPSVIAELADALESRPVSAASIDAAVATFAGQIINGLRDFRCVVVPTWTVPPWNRGRGVLDHRPNGVRWALSVANRRLAEALEGADNVFLADADRWLSLVGPSVYNQRLDYMGKVPFDEMVFTRAAEDIVGAFSAVRDAPRKLLVLDLDNTLWGGVVGDVGWEQLRLGGHDSVGEAFVDFQRALKGLQRRGIVLAIASKNDEEVALDAIDHHPAMLLRRADFAAWRIDWLDKAANIAAVAQTLNLGLQSVVFIDDNPHERERVRAALPEVLVPDWPLDPTQYVEALAALRCFESASVTAEDLDRTAMYAAEQRRAELRVDVSSLDDWIRELGMVVRAEPLGPANLPRATQLLNKTNQLNLRTRRLTSPELAAWAASDGRLTWCVSVSDRLGDAGLTGLLSVEVTDETAELTDFVLSCRVMGRRVEETMVHLACRMAIELGARKLVAQHLPTAKNAPCRRFFDSGPLPATGDGEYSIELGPPTPAPDGIEIRVPQPAVNEG